MVRSSSCGDRSGTGTGSGSDTWIVGVICSHFDLLCHLDGGKGDIIAHDHYHWSQFTTLFTLPHHS